jgi:hypothetical protein
MAGELEPARNLAETQLQVQFTILAGLDTQALGILGVDVALAALAIAARGVLEKLWWAAVVALAVSGLACLVALLGSSDYVGPKIEDVLNVGGAAAAADGSTPADKYVADGLRDAIELNEQHIGRGSQTVGVAVLLLVSALIAAGVSAAIVS